MFKLALVLRYLRKRKIAFFPVAGVALGVMALVVVLSVMEGFETDFRGRIRGIMPDMTIQFLDTYGFTGDIEGIVGAIEQMPEVRAVSPFVSGVALANVEVPREDGMSSYVFTVPVDFKGFDFARENAVIGFIKGKHLKYGEDPFASRPYGTGAREAPFVAGARIAGRKFEGVRVKEIDWGILDRGSRIQLVTFTPGYDRSRLTGVVEDVVSTGIYDIDEHTLFLGIDWARALRELPPNTVSGISVALKEYRPEAVETVRLGIHEALAERATMSNYIISTWEESRRTFLTAVAMERRIMAFILFFFLVVAGFSISAILIMIVLEKVRDIGILGAMGASPRGIATVFLTYGIAIGIAGAVLGLLAGVAFVKNLDTIEQFIYQQTGWQPFPPDIYDLPEIPRILNWWTNSLIALTAVAVSFLASVLPAVRAAWLDPVEAIRYE